MTKPVCTIIAGPNGAGKTTFAMTYLPSGLQCRNFVNADLIASGLSPLDPGRGEFHAARLFRQELQGYVNRRESFAFETTLAGRAYLKLVGQLMADDWHVELVYLWLSSPELCQSRVAERVAHGGHDIPVAVIRRRYPKSITHLLDHYGPRCSRTTCLDNSAEIPRLIFVETVEERVVGNQELYAALCKGMKHD